MKKIFLFVMLAAVSLTVAAQSLNVQSAAMNLRKGYLSRAKEEIDKACAYPETQDNAKTWYYAALVYRQIGEESEKPNSKYKDLDKDWMVKALDAVKRCMELDKTGEYGEEMNQLADFLLDKAKKKQSSANNGDN